MTMTYAPERSNSVAISHGQIAGDALGMPYSKYVSRMLSGALARSKESGIEFSITAEDIVIPSHCPILDIPLRASTNGATDNSPALDRIDSAKGYVPDNVHVISQRANRLKSDATLEELIDLGLWAVDRLGEQL